MNSKTIKEMEFTGERYVPCLEGDIALEHRHRYLLARELCRGKAVLDIASGEGYGSAILAEVAKTAVGIDIASDVVSHAQGKYPRRNLKFMVGSCADIPLPAGSFDLVVSFETLEHHDCHDEMMGEIKRVLRPGGVLIVSSPDRYQYSVLPKYRNPYHVKELYYHEFKQLLRAHFKNSSFYGQRVIFGSAIFRARCKGRTIIYRHDGQHVVSSEGLRDPLYWIAVASDSTIPVLPSGLLEHPVSESQIVSDSRQIIAQRDSQLAVMDCALSKQTSEVDALRTELADRQAIVAKLDNALSERCVELETVRRKVIDCQTTVVALEQALLERTGEVDSLKSECAERHASLAAVEWEISERIGEVDALRSRLIERGAEAIALQGALLERTKELDIFRAKFAEREAITTALEQAILDRIAELDRLRGELDERRAAVATLDEALLERTSEVEVLRSEHVERNGKVIELETTIAALYDSTSWRITEPVRSIRRSLGRLRMSALGYALTQGWRVLRKASFAPLREWQAVGAIVRSGVFDDLWYLKNNPDVTRLGINPIRHYVAYGAREGRDPSPFFSTRAYLARCPDVAAAGVNPLGHFVRFGAAEGRWPLPRQPRQVEVFNKPSQPVPAPLKGPTTGPKFPLTGYLTVHPNLDEQNLVQLDISVSVVIPTYNAGSEFYWLIRKLFTQKGIRRVEVVIVDSGSTDGTDILAIEMGCKLVSINKSQFSHSYSRNLGADNASGDLLLFMVQDAFPIGDLWLYGLASCLVRPYGTNECLAALSCAEYPRSDTEMLYNALIDTHYKFLQCRNGDRVGRLTSKDNLSLRAQGQLSDIACLIPRRLFEQYRYQGDYAEDLILGTRLIQDGHKIGMLSSIKVVHSHNRPASYYVRRVFVDVIFLTAVFPDFRIPATTSAGATLVAAFALRDATRRLAPSFGERPAAALDRIIAELRALRLPRSIHDFSGGGDFGYPPLGAWIDRVANGLGKVEREMTNREESDAAQLHTIFIDRLIALKDYVDSTYAVLDDTITSELNNAVAKTFAMAFGSQLAFLFLTSRFGPADVSAELISELKTKLIEGI